MRAVTKNESIHASRYQYSEITQKWALKNQRGNASLVSLEPFFTFLDLLQPQVLLFQIECQRHEC